MSKQITITDSSYNKLKSINKTVSIPTIDIIDLMLCYSNKDDLIKFISTCNSNKVTLESKKLDDVTEKDFIMYLNTLNETELRQKQFKINQIIEVIKNENLSQL